MEYATAPQPQAAAAPSPHPHPHYPYPYPYPAYHYPAASYQPAPTASASSSSYYPNPSAPASYDPYASYQYYAPLEAAAPAPAAAGGGGGGLEGFYYAAGEVSAAPAPALAAAAAAGKEAVKQYGFDPQLYAQVVAARSSNGITPPAPAPMHHAQWNAHFGHPLPRNVMRKHIKKKPKVAQPVFCEVCKIECDTLDVLKIHKQGKKHKKNLEKLQDAITAKLVRPPNNTISENMGPSAVDNSRTPTEQQKKKKSAVATPEELEVKKRRVLEAGAPEGEVRICTVCNVVVNSQKVYEFHMAGQKHQAMVQKQQAQQHGS